jgi:hypothetical protein
LKADRIVFLDTDTLILKRLDPLWENRSADFLGRVASGYGAPTWDPGVWRETSDDSGSPVLPMYNAGVLIFQNGSHRRIGPAWDRGIRKYLTGAYRLPYPDARMPEQFALSLALGATGLSRLDLGPAEHGFGGVAPPDLDPLPVVFHTGNKKFDAWARKLGVR